MAPIPNPLDEVPPADREQVAPEKIMKGDRVYDPARNRWLDVEHIVRVATAPRIAENAWRTDEPKLVQTFYYFTTTEWQRAGGLPDDRLVTRRTRSATNRERMKTTRPAGYKPPTPRHPRGPGNGFPRPGE